MFYTSFPKENLKLSKLALGTKVFVDKINVKNKVYKYTLNNSPDSIIKFAIDNGVNFFESASFYPKATLSFLAKKFSDLRTSIVLNFRVGYRADKNDQLLKEKEQVISFLAKKDIINDVEQLLKILKTDYIDIVTICGLEKNSEYTGDVLDAFYTLQKRGCVRFSSLYLKDPSYLLFLTSYLKNFNFCQLTYNVLNQDFSPYLAEISKQCNIIACAPFSNGVLSKKYTQDAYFKENDPRTIFYSKDKLKDLNNFIDELSFLEIKKEPAKPLKKSRTFAQGALNFVLQDKNISSTILCCSSLEQIHENINAFETEPLTQSQIDLIKTLYKKSQ